MIDIVIRPWLPEDVDTLMEWYERDPSLFEGMGVPRGTDLWKLRHRLVTSPGTRFMALRDDVPVAAFAVYDVHPSGLGFCSVIASPDGSGFSTVRAAERMRSALFNGIGMNELRVVVDEKNDAALKLARMIGFDDLGVRTLRLVKEE